MNRELEGLIVTYDAALQQQGAEALNALSVYQAKFGDVLAKHPDLDPQKLQQAIVVAHKRWVRAQKQHPSIPPQV